MIDITHMSGSFYRPHGNGGDDGGNSGLPLTARFERTTYDGFGREVKREAGDNGTQTVLSTVETQYAPCACSPLGKLWRVSSGYKAGETVVWTTYEYDASGRTTRVTAPDGVSATTYGYQGNQTTVTDAAGKWKTYTRDAMGNLTQVTEPSPAGATGYQYDALNHLTQVTMQRAEGTQVRSFNYDAGTQRLASVQMPESGLTTYAYNADGTMQSKTDAKGQRTQYSYDAYQRVTKTEAYPAGASQPDACQTVTYLYDLWTIDELGTLSNGYGRLTGMYWSSPSCQYGFAEEYAYTSAGQVFLKQMRVQNYWNNAPEVKVQTGFRYDAEGRLSLVAAGSGQSGALCAELYI